MVTTTHSNLYLPDDCWECIFKFIIDNDDNNRRYLYPLSAVSKQFLSIIDPLRLSLTVLDLTRPFIRRLSKRFTNLTSLNLSRFHGNLDHLLHQISRFPSLNITSLNLSGKSTIPTYGLRAFSQNITTLTSLTCSKIAYFNTTDLFLIVECFPLLEELNFSYPLNHENCYVEGVEALSLALIKLRKVNLSGSPIDNQSLFHLLKNCKLLEEAIMFDCDQISNEGIAFALRERPTLSSFSFSGSSPNVMLDFTAPNFVDILVSLKGLTCLSLRSLKISNELFYSFVREDLPLTSLVIQNCTGYSYAGIFCLLSKGHGVQHLDLERNMFLNDHHVVQLRSFLGDLISINLSDCDKLTERVLFTLVKNCHSLSEIKMEHIGSNSGGNSEFLVDFGVYPQLKSLYLGRNSWLNDERIVMIASTFPNLQLLDLTSSTHISEGICEVLRRCCKIKHLNLSGCYEVKLHSINFVVPKLEVLDLSGIMVDDEILHVISKKCCCLLQLILGHKYFDVTEEGVKLVVEKCTQLREINLGDFLLSYKQREFFSRRGCLLC